MSTLLVKACVLLAVTTHAGTQYSDFFQSFNAFLQPIGITKPKHEVTKRPETKHRQTNKHKYDDVIHFQADDAAKEVPRFIDPVNLHSNKRKTTKSSQFFTTTRPNVKPKTVNSNKIINNNINSQVIRSINHNNGETINNNVNSFSVFNNPPTTTKYNVYNRPTTGRNRHTTGKHTAQYNQHNNNYGTTLNPLFNRPGVKPAPVDENRPPITNRPVTKPIYDIPFDTGAYRPANTRPPYEFDAGQNDRFDSRPINLRPVNTRPPIEIERPVTSRPYNPASAKPSEQVEPEIEIGPDEDEMSNTEKRRYFEMCEQKCSEYKSAFNRKVSALPLAGNQRAEFNVSSCYGANVPLIIGGQVVDITQFPHMALVGWPKLQGAGYSWKCGGSLVSERHILTAGHCTYYDKDDNIVSGPPHAVQLGSSHVEGRDGTVVRVATIIRHPKYKFRRSYYDVAIIKLVQVVTFSEKIRPACLGVPPPVGDPIIATGWGKTEFGGDTSVELRSVSIPIWDMAECREIWGTSRKLPEGPMADNQLCAGERKGAKDTCQGDSGGPAQVQDGCSWRVVGITSVGRSCGAPETPALYAKIPRAFIASQIYTNAKTNTNTNSGNNNRGSENNWGSVNNGGVTNNNNKGSVNNNWGSVNNGGMTNNNRGSENNNRGSENNNWGNVNNGGVTNNNRGSENNWGSANNGGVTNNNKGSENNNWGNVNNGEVTNNNRGSENNWGSANNGGVTNNNKGSENNNWGNVNINRGSENNRGSANNGGVTNTDRGTQNNIWGVTDSNGGITNRGVANIRPVQNINRNGQLPNQKSDRESNNNLGTNTQNNRNVYDRTTTTTVRYQNAQNNYNPIVYAQTGYNEKNRNTDNYGVQSINEQTDYNRNNENVFNNYPVNQPWWAR